MSYDKRVGHCYGIGVFMRKLQLSIRESALMQFIEKRFFPLSFYFIVETIKINVQDFIHNPPIIVYQMGKVGSSTVFKSLKGARLSNSIYHFHFLTYNGIKQAEEYFLSLQKPIIPTHLRLSKSMYNKLGKTKGVRPKIITLVREPIARDISDFFHNMRSFYPNLINKDGDVDKNLAIKILQKKFINFDESTNYTCSWFDKELNPAFNIDVYDYSFDHDNGFTIIRTKNAELLILRLETLDQCFDKAFMTFLIVPKPINMIRSNISKNKKYAQAYRCIVENIRIPKSVVEKIYSSKYVKHFYNENMRRGLTKKWSKTC